MEDQHKNPDQAREPVYERPQITRIRLEADQVLSNGCKGTWDSASGAIPCSSNGCMGSGS